MTFQEHFHNAVMLLTHLLMRVMFLNIWYCDVQERYCKRDVQERYCNCDVQERSN